MKILIVDDDNSIRDFLILVFENLFTETDILEGTSGSQAIKIFESDPYYELVICDFNMDNGNGSVLYHHLKNKGHKIPFIFFTSQEKTILEVDNINFDSDPNLYYIKKGCRISEFKQHLLNFSFIKKSSYLPASQENFMKVRIFSFWRFSKTLCDIYLKINEQKFVKIIKAGDIYGPEIINKYADKSLKYLYINKDDYEQFAVNIAQTPFLQFDNGLKTEDKIARSNAIIQHLARSVGINKVVVSMTKDSVDLVIQESKKYKYISSLLKSLKERMDYGYDHANFLCFIACALCDSLGWTTRRSKEKLCFASLFHDISLTEANLAIIQTEDDDLIQALDDENKNRYFKHPELAASAIEELTNEYPQVDQIILMHHERPDGSGFPKGVSFTQIPPLPSLFIVAHEYVSELYKCDFDDEKQKEIFINIEKKYNLGHFVKIVECLKRLVE